MLPQPPRVIATAPMLLLKQQRLAEAIASFALSRHALAVAFAATFSVAATVA